MASQTKRPSVKTTGAGASRPAASSQRSKPTEGPQQEGSPAGADILSSALAYAAGGLPVFPLTGKVPRKGTRGFKDATTEPARIRAAFSHGANVGIPTGAASGLVALDADSAEGEAALAAICGGTLPVTRTHRTGRGRHFIFLYPKDPVPSRTYLRPGLDVRGDGGYIVAPPSVHPDTNAHYVVEDPTVPIAPLPDALRLLLTTPPRPSPAPTPAPAEERWGPGERNARLTRLAGAARRHGASEEAILALLGETNATRCDPPLGDAELSHIARSVGRYAPTADGDGPASTPVVRTLAAIIADPSFGRVPSAVAERFAWRGRLTLLSGREKLGKTTLTAKVAASVTRCMPLFGMEPTLTVPAAVLWCALEGHVDDVAYHLLTFGADPNRVLMLDRLGDPATRLNALAEIVAAHRPALIVVDTLSSLVSGAIDDPKGDSAAWTLWMNGLGHLARDADAAVLVTHHARKSDGRYRDSTAIGAGADMILELLADERDATARIIEPKGRWSVPRFVVRLEGEEYVLAASADAASLEERILGFVRQHPGCTQRDLLDRLPGRKQTKRDALAKLVGTGALARSDGPGGGHAYRLTEAGAGRLESLRAAPM